MVNSSKLLSLSKSRVKLQNDFIIIYLKLYKSDIYFNPRFSFAIINTDNVLYLMSWVFYKQTVIHNNWTRDWRSSFKFLTLFLVENNRAVLSLINCD